MKENDGQIDYSTYTYPELLQALNSIDRHTYPKNYANLERAIEQVSPAMREAYEAAPPSAPEFPDDELDRGDSLDDPEPKDPEVEYIKHLTTALAVAGISAYLLWVGDITLQFGDRMTIALRGFGETLGRAAFLFAISVPASFILNLVDDRDNQKVYRLYALFAESIATLLLIGAWIVSSQ